MLRTSISLARVRENRECTGLGWQNSAGDHRHCLPFISAVGIEAQPPQRGDHGSGVNVCVVVRLQYKERVQIVYHPLQCQEHLHITAGIF